MKIYLTGASGVVGSAFATAARRRGHEVMGVVGGFAGDVAGLAQRISLDLTKSESVTRSVLDVFPDAVVNCAAVSEPAACELDPERSDAMNVRLPHRMAELARHVGARFIHVSSEQVFDGASTRPYAEMDEVAPINLYGRQKVASERRILEVAAELSAIVRAPLLMGNSPSGRRGLHERLLNDWSLGKPARLYGDEFRQPCTGENLADVLLELVERKDVTGVFHWAGRELLSRYELGLCVREHFKLNEQKAPIVRIERTDTPEIARTRQACLALNISALSSRLKTRPQSLAEQLPSLQLPAGCREWYFRSG